VRRPAALHRLPDGSAGSSSSLRVRRRAAAARVDWPASSGSRAKCPPARASGAPRSSPLRAGGSGSTVARGEHRGGRVAVRLGRLAARESELPPPAFVETPLVNGWASRRRQRPGIRSRVHLPDGVFAGELRASAPAADDGRRSAGSARGDYERAASAEDLRRCARTGKASCRTHRRVPRGHCARFAPYGTTVTYGELVCTRGRRGPVADGRSLDGAHTHIPSRPSRWPSRRRVGRTGGYGGGRRGSSDASSSSEGVLTAPGSTLGDI
jgi:hypothetical protein